MPKPYPQEFGDDVVRVARNREPGVPPEGGHARAAAAAERLRVRQWHRERAETLAAGWSEFAPAASRLLGSIPGAPPKDAHLRRVTECVGA